MGTSEISVVILKSCYYSFLRFVSDFLYLRTTALTRSIVIHQEQIININFYEEYQNRAQSLTF